MVLFLTTFEEHIKPGATIFLHCKCLIWGTATVSSEYFYEETKIWTDKIYPHHFKIDNVNLLKNPIVVSNGVYNADPREQYGSPWAFSFISASKPLPLKTATMITDDIKDAELQSLEDLETNFKTL